jgi:hypothetical protein
MPGPAPARSSLASAFLAKLGKTKLMVGADMNEQVAESAPFDARYLYIAGGLADGNGTCSSCASGCTAKGVSCANTAGCGWWACWQDVSLPPGKYLRDFLDKAQANNQLPMLTYYELLQTGTAAEGSPEVVELNDVALMTRYYNDWRFVLQQVGTRTALMHIEPDLWGYAEKLNPDPHRQPAAVARANPTDCASQEESVAGFGRCLISMVRKYAPNAKVGLHASGWATGADATENRNPSFDVAADGRKVADFLLECGAGESDYVVLYVSDRDAGWRRAQGAANPFWDATGATLPNFKQAFAWGKAVTERMMLPSLWWSIPLGNMSLPNVVNRWQDNKLDYFFAHAAEVAASNAFGMLFGSGEVNQTNPSTDGGNLVMQVRTLAAAGGQAVCR